MTTITYPDSNQMLPVTPAIPG